MQKIIVFFIICILYNFFNIQQQTADYVQIKFITTSVTLHILYDSMRETIQDCINSTLTTSYTVSSNTNPTFCTRPSRSSLLLYSFRFRVERWSWWFHNEVFFSLLIIIVFQSFHTYPTSDRKLRLIGTLKRSVFDFPNGF